MENQNELFIKHALQDSIFTANMLANPIVIDKFMDSLEEGRRIEMCLNIMTYADFARWTQQDISRLIDFIIEIINESEEKNKILLTSNTIMALAHCCEFLKKISSSIKVFRKKCRHLLEDIAMLAEKIVDNVDDELIESIFLDRDYKDRTLFKVITSYKLYSFLTTGKVHAVLDAVWFGVSSNECDGTIYDFSLLTFLANSKVNHIPGKKLSIKQLLTNNYETNIKDLNFWFQYKFRAESVSYIFKKELLCAAGIAVAFQYINFMYLDLFAKETYSDLATDALKEAKLEDQISTYNGINFIGSIFAATLLYSCMCRYLFNILSEVKAVWDRWTILDGVTGVVALFCFNITGSITPQDILDPTRKQTFDSYVVIILVVAWLRFFSFFLVIRSISKLLMTLFQMLIDTISFSVIMCCYLLLMASVFTTLFQGANQDSYGSMSSSLRTLFDTMLGNYGSVDMSYRDDLHTYLRMVHIVASNIFLLNYLIAILSTAYEYMNDVGEFEYKANRYAYAEKYQTAQLDKKGFSELVAYPAPFNILNLFILPFTLVPNTFKEKAEVFGKLMYWVDNILLILIFFVYCVVLIPFIFFKVLLNLFQSTSIIKFLPLSLMWIVFGFVFLPLYSIMDTVYLIIILCSYGDAEDQSKEKLLEEVIQDRIVVFNEVMDVMNAIQLLFKPQAEPVKQKTFYRSMTRFASMYNKVDNDDDHEQKILINKDLIVQAWVRYRPNDNIQAALSNKNFLTVVEEHFIKKIMDNVNKNNQNIDFDDENSDISMSQNGDIGERGEVPEAELKMINDFLARFLVTSISHQKDKIDVALALQALPKHINEHNVTKINLINFGAIRQSLNALRNDDQRSMKRFVNLWAKSKENTDEVNSVKELAFRMIYKIGKLIDIDPNEILDPRQKEDDSKSNMTESEF